MPFNTNNNFYPCNICTERTSISHADCDRYKCARTKAEKEGNLVKSRIKGQNEATSVLVESRMRIKKRLLIEFRCGINDTFYCQFLWRKALQHPCGSD